MAGLFAVAGPGRKIGSTFSSLPHVVGYAATVDGGDGLRELVAAEVVFRTHTDSSGSSFLCSL